MKFKLTKKRALYLANAVALIIIITAFIINVFYAYDPYDIFMLIFSYILYEALIAFSLLLVYHLSVMAEALTKKYKENKKDK